MNSNTKKTLEALLVGGVLVVSMSNAHSAVVCTTGAGISLGGDAASTSFVKTVFTPKCSANSVVDIVDLGPSFGAMGASTKGNQIYGGSTEGGGVTLCTTFGAWKTIDGKATASAGCGDL